MEVNSKHDTVVESVNKLFVYTDERQWNKLLNEVFADDVLFDMSSVGGGAAKTIKAKDICQMWDEGFKGIDHVHHQSGNFIVTFKNDSTEADVFCYAIAIHYKASASKGKTREFVGSYNVHLSFTDKGWKVDAFKYNLKYINGNADLT